MKKADGPAINKLSCREFLKFSGLVVAGVLCAPAFLSARSARAEEKPAPNTEYKKVKLTSKVMRNPGFMVKELRDGRLMAWVRRPNGEFTGYSFNTLGRFVWKLCDGNATEKAISEEYSKTFSRPATEVHLFLDELRKKGLLSQGGYVVSSAGFPKAPSGRYLKKMVW